MGQQYMVFARGTYEQSLTLQGWLAAEDAVEAQRLASERFGVGWVELSLVPEAATRWILRSDQPIHGEELAR